MSHRRWQKGSIRIQGQGWCLRYRVDIVDAETGLTRRAERTKRLGPSTHSREWAAKAARRLMRSISPEPRPIGKSSAVAKAFDAYERDHLILVKHSTQAVYRSMLRRHLRPAFQGLPLAQLDTAAVQARLVTPMRSAGLRRETIQAAIVLLTRIIRLAQSQGYAVGKFEPRQLALPVPELRPERVYSEDQVAMMLSAELEPQQRAFFDVLALTGLRTSEALALQWSDVAFDTRTLYVRRSAVDGKIGTCKTAATAAPRAMSAQLVERLERWRAVWPPNTHGLLFATRTGRPIWRSHVHRSWLRPLLRRMGLESRGLHALRHAFGHAAGLEAGATELRDLMRHRDLATSQRYVSSVTSNLRSANQAVSDRLCGAKNAGNAPHEVADQLRSESGREA